MLVSTIFSSAMVSNWIWSLVFVTWFVELQDDVPVVYSLFLFTQHGSRSSSAIFNKTALYPTLPASFPCIMLTSACCCKGPKSRHPPLYIARIYKLPIIISFFPDQFSSVKRLSFSCASVHIPFPRGLTCLM